MALFDELKSIANILQEIGKIKELQQILNAQKELLEMQKRIGELEAENKELKEKLKVKCNLIFEKSCYWIKKEDGSKEGPFCPTCWEKDYNVIHLLQQRPNWDIWACNVCKAIVFGIGVYYREK